ncbi:MAG: hypothetical protein JJE50_05065 [Actinomycetales bacterium]|nr:hypothetical protein [Actinomycetales bacterium]
MPSFAFDSGHLVPASFGRPAEGSLAPEVVAALREYLLDVIEVDLFPVAWSQGPDPILTAMDRGGRVVTAVVTQRLDSAALVRALAAAGETAATGWLTIAGRYRNGVPGFRRDWNAFRESRPVGAQPGPDLHIVTGEVSDDVRDALRVLPDVRVLAVDVREGGAGRQFLDVEQMRPERSRVRVLDAGVQVLDVVAPELGRAARPAAEECLRAVAELVEAPVPIVLREDRDSGEDDGVHRATLQADGVVVLADGSEHGELSSATTDVLGREHPDAWSAWAFADGGLPLADALAESARADRQVRSHPHARRAAEPGRHRRRREAIS